MILVVALMLSACGTKDAESVVKDLDKFVNSMESYQGSGTMTLHNGQQPQSYEVDVSFQQPHYYRIKLTNKEKDITQIVLKNDDGVFVLTPKLNKVFRFQSEWPQNQGQVYLYQTLAQSIITDSSRQFASNDDAYVFDVMANYNSGSLARQKIWLNKADLSPLQVEVSDTNARVQVDVKFDTFKFDQRFDEGYFNTDANLRSESAAEQSDEPTAARPEDEEQDGITAPGDEGVGTTNNEESPVDGNSETNTNETDQDEDADTDANSSEEEDADASVGTESEPFTVMGPSYTPEGVAVLDETDIVFSGQPGQMTRYDGIYSYTLIQTQAQEQAASFMQGTIVDLGFTLGELTGGDGLQTLTWTYHGSQFRITSDNLPQVEMENVAKSVQAEMGK
ncbi:DUF4367 domain-containing protein [Paenibacillus sp. J5C_2022]|nr:DUF4367 domain-containing protein [Paenibacillus sp. J5C2022]